MSAAVDAVDCYPTGPICEVLPVSLQEEQYESPENGQSAGSPSAESSSAPLSPHTPPSRVVFSVELEGVTPEKKDRERYLTAKYPKHQTGLIRKRLAVEDWVDAELKILFDIVSISLPIFYFFYILF